MEIDELIDKYRAFKPQKRYILLSCVALVIPINFFLNNGMDLDERLGQVNEQYESARKEFEDARQQAAELPAKEAQLSDVESELVKAKEFLPDKIEVDSILAFLGGLEKELDVKLIKFQPGVEVAGPPGLEYKELPVEIQLHGTFGNTMRFMDRMVHMQSLTHMRNIQFSAPELTDADKKDQPAEGGARKVDSTSKLILFKGV